MPRLQLILAWIALLWERTAPVLAPGLGALALYLSLTLFGAWDALGDPWRALTLFALAIGAAWLTRRALRNFTSPDEEDAARRLEEDSGLDARPHEALADAPVDDDPLTHRLWAEHRKRMRARLAKARARRPKPAWMELDPWGLRGFAAVAVIFGFAAAGPIAGDRLGEAFSPSPIGALRDVAVLDAWIDPPAFTGRAPILLGEDIADAEAPQGAVFVARLAGSDRPPRLVAQFADERRTAEIEEIGDNAWEARLILDSDAELRFRGGGLRRTWSVATLPDQPPTARLLADPEASAAGELELVFAVEDDYGAEELFLEFRPEGREKESWTRLSLQGLARAEQREGEPAFRARVETAQERLAGERVDVRLAARDAAGQTGVSETAALTLPERVFLDALARAVSEQRRRVLDGRDAYAPLEEPEALDAGALPPGPAIFVADPARRIERAPEPVQDVAAALTAITDAPEFYFDDPIVYLTLREALFRLQRARSDGDLGALDADLWEIALRAELGGLADAEAALAAAERALNEALARGADATELAALIDAFEQAMEAYIAALGREAAEAAAEGDGEGGGMVSADAFAQMLRDLQDAAELGDAASARELLNLLTTMLRNLQVSPGGGAGGENALIAALREALSELGDLISAQRELQERTFELSQRRDYIGGPTGDGSPGSDELSDRQGELSTLLDSALAFITDEQAQREFELAVDAMDGAAESLALVDLTDALAEQGAALTHLRDGSERIAELLRELEQSQQGEEGGEETDPLGREQGAGADNNAVPDRERAREILEELRDRARETGRPQEELDYIERLLDRFGS
jgi:hypothetical protein